MHATGSKAHLEELATLARKKKISIDADGIRRAGNLIAATTEESVYKAVGIPYIPPELREGADEIRAR